MTRLIRGVHDLVVEDGEVESETQADGVGGGKIGASDLGGILVGLQRQVGGVLALVTKGEFREITVIISLPGKELKKKSHARKYVFGRSLHLVIEDLGLSGLGRGNEMLVQDLQDILADPGQFGLDLLAVFLDQSDLALVAL